MVQPITTVASGFSRNTPNTMLLDRRLSQMFLQPQHQCPHGCGIKHNRVGEIVSSPSQYKIYRDLSSILFTEFS
jgi:hypothetical protein